MTDNGLLTKKEALEKIEEIFKDFESDVYKKLDYSNKNDLKIIMFADCLKDFIKKSLNENFSYKDVVILFNDFKKLAENYKLSWLNKKNNSIKNIKNKELKLLNLRTGLAELIEESSDDIIRYILTLEETDYEELFELTTLENKKFFLNLKTSIYHNPEKNITTYEGASTIIDSKVQVLATFLGMLAQQTISSSLNFAGDFCSDNKVYFLRNGLKKGEKFIEEFDIPALAGNIVFTKKAIDSLCDTYFIEDNKFQKQLINDLIKDLTASEQSEIKKFIKSNDCNKNDVLFKININEFDKLDISGPMYKGGKKFDQHFSSSINTEGLKDFDILKSSPVDYIFNLIQKEIFKFDVGINAGNAGSFANAFTINLSDKYNKTAKSYSFLIKDLDELFSRSTIEQLNLAIKTTGTEISDTITYNKENLSLLLTETIKNSGHEETGGFQYELNEKSNLKTTNIVNLNHGKNKRFTGFEIQNQVSGGLGAVADIELGHHFKTVSNETEIKNLCLYAGISLNFSELDKRLNGQNENEFIKAALLRLGVTYTRNYVESDNKYKISTDFKCLAFEGTINIGLVVDSSVTENNKMKFSYEYRCK